jgi:DNA invertase Pin-like site-specific DNA recombinase
MITLRVAIYARVSTHEGKQDPETQLHQLRQYAAARDFTIIGEFIDYATGRNEQRPQYQQLFDLVRKRQADIVLVWRYDRFARSTKALITALNEFRTLGVNFISYQENIDTTTPQGEMVFTIMASLAQFEGALIAERTRAGMERARAQGKQTWRPAIPTETQVRIAVLRKDGVSINKIAKELGIAYSTAHKYVKSHAKERPRSKL